MNIQTENNQQEDSKYFLPYGCGSPYQNMRPMTPIDNAIQILYYSIDRLSYEENYKIYQYLTNILFNDQQQQQQIYHANHADCHDKVDFQSISEKEVKEIKLEVKEEVKVHLKDDEKEEDDEEVSNANSGSESESEPDNSESKPNPEHESKIESKPKYEPKSETTKSKQSSTKVDTSTFIFGKIVSIDDGSKAKVRLSDGREGSFPTNFKYYGKIGDKVRLSIKYENKDKRMLILNFINIHFEKDDEVTGIISVNDSNVVYINVHGIKMATFPKTFNHTGLRDGMKVLCSVYKTYDYKEKNSNNVVGLAANLTFKSIIY